MIVYSHALVLFLATGLAAWLLVLLVLRVAVKYSWMDVPNERSLHPHPTPRGGGIAIVAMSLTVVVIAGTQSGMVTRPFAAFGAGAALVAAISFVDDVRSVSAAPRFVVHVLGAVCALLGVGYWGNVEIPFVQQLSIGYVGIPIAFLWIVGLTNAYNFMDGVDGIAGVQGVVAGLAWTSAGIALEARFIQSIGIAVAASSCAFLAFNWHPARIFIGDVGSAFLGYVFAVLAVLGAEANSRLAFAGILFVWPFVFDAAFTLLRRLRIGENIFQAHRSHLYQRLVMAGLSHSAVALLYAGSASLTSVSAICWLVSPGWGAPLAAVSPVVSGGALWLFVVARERRPECA